MSHEHEYGLNPISRLVYEYAREWEKDDPLWEIVRRSADDDEAVREAGIYVAKKLSRQVGRDVTGLSAFTRKIVDVTLTNANYLAVAYALRLDERRRQGANG